MRAILATLFFCLLLPAAHAETASYCGFESGRHTASGERFDPTAMTAAHRTLPFGTLVRVTYQGRSVVLGNPSTICAGNVGSLLVLNMHGEFENDSTMTFSGPLTAANGVVAEGGLSNAIFGKVEGGSNVTGVKWILNQGSALSGSANVPGTSPGRTCSTCTAD